MTINPVLFGVLSTFTVELIVGFIALVVFVVKHKK